MRVSQRFALGSEGSWRGAPRTARSSRPKIGGAANLVHLDVMMPATAPPTILNCPAESARFSNFDAGAVCEYLTSSGTRLSRQPVKENWEPL